jgi:lipopolysaccharide/colanic/teichoic acid biosynthesis glycosyltransferase
MSGDKLARSVTCSTLPVTRYAAAPFWLRVVEVSVAGIILLVGLPVMVAQWGIIRLGTPGPGLFFQHRVGTGQRLFRFVKFRTMYVDARERFPHLYAYRYSPNELLSLKFKSDDDPRVTPQGRWLRRLSIDELPNFWNVLTGEMALVGPRPEIPEMLPYYKGEMLEKFLVRPGVTGLAQISGRGRLGFYETVELDVSYVRNRSLLLDVRILLKTIAMILLRDGAF